MVTRLASMMLRSICLAIVLANVPSSTVDAHEVITHQRLTDAAIDFWVKERPQLVACRAPEIRDALRIGVSEEDDYTSFPLGYFMHHFTPTLNSPVNGLLFGLLTASSSCNSSAWGFGTSNNCQSSLRLTSSSTPFKTSVQGTNPYRWDMTNKALLRYLPGTARKREGLVTVGHLVHLLQDLTSPAHTKNDAHPHLAPSGWVTLLGDPSAFEVINQFRPPWLIPQPVGGLLNFASEQNAFDVLRQWTSTNFYSEDNALDGSAPD